jgi:hypothetical protein
MTFFPMVNVLFPMSAIVGGVIDATAALSPLLWTMMILLLLCALMIAADRDRQPRKPPRVFTLVPDVVVHRERLIIVEGRRTA